MRSAGLAAVTRRIISLESGLPTIACLPPLSSALAAAFAVQTEGDMFSRDVGTMAGIAFIRKYRPNVAIEFNLAGGSQKARRSRDQQKTKVANSVRSICHDQRAYPVL